MTDEMLFLGHNMKYWMELQKRAELLGVEHLLRDIADLSAKVQYYEMMLDRIAAFRKTVNG